LKEAKGADYVRKNELLRADDGAIHMAFGGKIYNRIWSVGLKQGSHQCGVLDASMNEYVSSLIPDGSKIAKIACVRELVKVDHAIAGCDSL
jgi:hypothetical protein